MKYHKKGGFALPSVLIASVIMMTVLVASVSSVAALRASISAQYYNQLAKSASDAGVAYAKSCIQANAGAVTWSDTNKLGPNTDCSGIQLSGFTCPDNSLDERCSVFVGNNIITTFSVGLPTFDASGVVTKITANGIVELVRDSDVATWRTYNQTSQLSISNPTALNSTANISVLVVAGGGGGGSSQASNGGAGGGGAGGLVYNPNYSVSSGETLSVTVGGGGNPGATGSNQQGTNGSNSVFGTITAIGGGGGARVGVIGNDGGSGGGAGFNGYVTVYGGGNGVIGQGSNGGNTTYLAWAGGAGGGGAGGVGGDNSSVDHSGGVAGSGVNLSISGTLITYAAGGRGGGGAAGAASPANTGKGGDGAYAAATAYAGGSGIVIISYPTGSISATITNGATTISGGNTIHAFTSGSGTFTVNSIGTWAYRRDIKISNPNTYTMNDYQVLVTPFTDSNLINNTGLVGSWHFNEDNNTSKNLAFDSSGSGNHGSFSGATYKTNSGKFGNAFVGNGVDTNKVTVPYNASMNLTTSLSIEVWVNFASSATKEIVSSMNAGGTAPVSYELYQSGQRISFRLYKSSAGSILTTTTDLALNTWHHVVGTWDGATRRIYINGSLAAEDSIAAPIDAFTNTLSIGGYGNNTYLFNGKIDELKIYNRALTGPATNCSADYQNEVCIRYGNFGTPKIRGDYGDIRFTDSTGTKQYSYWQEADNKFWVKIPSLTPGESTIRMYYGNPIASSASNGDDTFAFFDDFNRMSIDNSKWIEIDPNNEMTQANGSLTLSAATSVWDSAWISRTRFSRVPGLVVGGAFKASSSVAAPNHVMIGWEINQETNPAYNQLAHAVYYNYGNLTAIYENGTGYASVGTYVPYSNNIFNIRLKSTGAEYYNNGSLLYSGAGGSLTSSPIRVGIHQYNHTGNIYYIYVRQGSPTEPTNTAPGTEVGLSNYVAL